MMMMMYRLFCWARKGQTIVTMLQVSKEARIVIDIDVGSTRESVDNLQLVENSPLFDNGNEDEDDEESPYVEVDPLLGGGPIWKGLDQCLRIL